MQVDTATACENCAAPLQGAFCHACGQHAANPLRSFAHALEDVFESFWHLDGRVFRTLRDLFVPGRVACNYLGGQRVRYIPPLRLFVVLTLVTFFVGQIAVSVVAGSAPELANSTIKFDDDDSAARSIKDAKTLAEVEAALARQLKELQKARKGTAFIPGVAVAMDQAEREVRKLAADRMAVLRAAQGTTAPAGAPHVGAAAPAKTVAAAKAPALATTAAPADATERSARDAAKAGNGKNEGPREMLEEMAPAIGRLRDTRQPWHERDNPVDIGALPPFADRWVNRRMGNFERNGERMQGEGSGALLAQRAMAAVPSALLVLVPVFALLLRLLYLLSGRGYLEHLVVALYSHSFMLLVLLGTFLLMLLRAGVPALTTPANLLQAAMLIALPVYLFAMQHRVYRQHWVVTAAKYLAIGMVYVFLVFGVVVYSVMAGITSGS